MTSIKEHCCGADQLFDEKSARKEYNKYRKKGPARVTRKLIAQLNQIQRGNSLLDIGGGIGAIQWWFLDHSGQYTIGVDASSGYTKIAKEHAISEELTEKTQFKVGDIVDFANEIPVVDHITLDKVICCYPEYKEILNLVTDKSAISISLSYPMDGIIARIMRGMGVIYMKLKGSAFKPYVHNVNQVRTEIEERGFRLSKRSLSFPWHVETYLKK